MNESSDGRQWPWPKLLVWLLLQLSIPCYADEIRVAVASNFAATLSELERSFAADRGHTLAISAGSTGKLFAQIVNGAPFDVLLAADSRRPKVLEEAGHAVSGSRFTYAAGRLVLWSADPTLPEDGEPCLQAMLEGPGRIAVANPATAPYGEAAHGTLRAVGDWQALGTRLVTGENVAQALHFAATGNARFAFVAESQLAQLGLPETGCRWHVPRRYHEPIAQQAVLLVRAQDSVAAKQFMAFLRSDETQRRLAERGYDVGSPE